MEGWWAASYLVLWLMVGVLTIVVVALARQIGTLHLRLGPRGALELDDEGPPLGEAPESFHGWDLDGREVTIGGPGEAQLLMFVSPGCTLCDQVMPSLPGVATSAGMTSYVVTDLDPAEAASAFSAKRTPSPVVAAPDIVRSYDVPGTPYIVMLDTRGVVRAKGTPNNLEQVEGLVDTARRRIDGPTHERRAG
ncbi:MAG: hypothetical protein ABR529_01010 [Actinomycetota bacterium]